MDIVYSDIILSPLQQLIPRHVFDAVERQHPSARKDRVFTRWAQFVLLALIHLAARPSMRDGIHNLDANSQQFYHLGIKPVSRSTFSDVNNKRPAKFFQTLLVEMYKRCDTISPVHKFRSKNKQFSLDASTIKLHTLLDHDGYILL